MSVLWNILLCSLLIGVICVQVGATTCEENHPCQNGATCKIEQNKAKCTCAEEWFGSKCDLDKKKYVESVVQNYKKETNTLIKSQIQKELMASYMYQAYASYFQRADVALPGIQKFFASASLEEREHAQMLIDYINTRGGHVQLDNIQLNTVCEKVYNYTKTNTPTFVESSSLCICEFVSKESVNAVPTTNCLERDQWKSGLMAFQDALLTERYVNQQLLDLQKAADESGDAHLTHILEHHFLDEQVQSISQLAGYVTRLKSFCKNADSCSNYHLGEYIFDSNLNK